MRKHQVTGQFSFSPFLLVTINRQTLYDSDSLRHDLQNHMSFHWSPSIGKPLMTRYGAGCSKLTTALVNVSLKFQMLISQIRQYFLLKNVRSFCSAKASLIFSTKNFSVFGYKVVKHLMS